MARLYDGRRLLRELRQKKEKEEWLFSIAVVKAGLEREGNLDAAAERELADALARFDLTPDELEDYLEKNRGKLLQFLDSSRTL
jgi:hypothetical protein